MKPKLILCLALVLSGGLFGCSTAVTNVNTSAPNRLSDLPIRYHNSRYDFTFFLPTSWQGYSVLIQQWEGQTYSAAVDRLVVTGHGSMIVLRHPQWKASDPYQDIPILVFTRSQWDALHQGKFFPSLYAGGTMDEMWHNRKYVFAISSRYNWGELKGWAEAGEIVEQNRAAGRPHLYPE